MQAIPGPGCPLSVDTMLPLGIPIIGFPSGVKSEYGLSPAKSGLQRDVLDAFDVQLESEEGRLVVLFF